MRSPAAISPKGGRNCRGASPRELRAHCGRKIRRRQRPAGWRIFRPFPRAWTPGERAAAFKPEIRFFFENPEARKFPIPPPLPAGTAANILHARRHIHSCGSGLKLCKNFAVSGFRKWRFLHCEGLAFGVQGGMFENAATREYSDAGDFFSDWRALLRLRRRPPA